MIIKKYKLSKNNEVTVSVLTVGLQRLRSGPPSHLKYVASSVLIWKLRWQKAKSQKVLQSMGHDRPWIIAGAVKPRATQGASHLYTNVASGLTI